MLKAMIVEDNLDLSRLLDKIASDTGFKADCITQATTFERDIDWGEYDLILLDVGVSDFNEKAVTKMTLSDTNICLMSVFKENLIGQLTRTVTYDYFLQKPFRIETLKHILTLSEKNNNRVNFNRPLTANRN